MQTKHFSLPTLLFSAVAVLALGLLTAVLWLSPTRSVQAASTESILSSSYDVWQAGGIYLYRELGLFPVASDMTTPRIALYEDVPLTTTKLGFLGSAPLTTTVIEARLVLDRSPSPLPSANTLLELGVCEGTDVLRVVSSAPIDVGVAPEHTWMDIPLVSSPDDLTIEPPQYLCYTGRRISEGGIDVYMVIQAAVRYWAPPTDQLYLPAVSH